MRHMNNLIYDLEDIILEMAEEHELQCGDILALVKNYIDVHLPGAIEVYEEDGTSPIYFYGPKETLLKLAKTLK